MKGLKVGDIVLFKDKEANGPWGTVTYLAPNDDPSFDKTWAAMIKRKKRPSSLGKWFKEGISRP